MSGKYSFQTYLQFIIFIFFLIVRRLESAYQRFLDEVINSQSIFNFFQQFDSLSRFAVQLVCYVVAECIF